MTLEGEKGVVDVKVIYSVTCKMGHFGPRHNVQFQKISILPRQKGLEFPGGGGWGFCKTKNYEA